MMWTDKAFGIWMGDAGKGHPQSLDSAESLEGNAFERAFIASDECIDETVTPRVGVVSRAIAAFADRTQLSRIARG